jgi:hypothetical protein
MTQLKSTFAFENDNLGNLSGVSHEEEQRACYTTAGNSTDTEDAQTFWAMLGIEPDKEYQLYLRAERSTRKG